MSQVIGDQRLSSIHQHGKDAPGISLISLQYSDQWKFGKNHLLSQ
jgi:hypothetical protein